MFSASTGKKKIKKAVEKEMTTEVKRARKRKDGWKLVKGESAGKLAIRTEEEYLIYGDKSQVVEFIASGGRFTLIELHDKDDSTESHYNTVEIYKVSPKNSESYFWFVERI